MKRLWVVNRRIEFQLGDAVAQACAAFESEKEAKRAAQLRDGAIASILLARLSEVDGGKTIDGGVKGFIQALGISGIGHSVLPVRVTEESPLVSPDGDNVVPIGGPSPIIMP